MDLMDYPLFPFGLLAHRFEGGWRRCSGGGSNYLLRMWDRSPTHIIAIYFRRIRLFLGASATAGQGAQWQAEANR